MKLYLDLWNSPGLMRVVLAQLLARFPYGMMVLAIVMHVQHSFKSYAIAGLAMGAETILSAISGPLLGRLVGRVGILRVFLPTSILSVGIFLLIAFTPFAPWWIILLCGILGFVQPPIQSVARTVYPRLIKPELRNSIFTLDATSQELIWILGPVIATFAAAQVSTVFAMVLMASIQAVGIFLFLSNKNVRTTEIEKTEKQIGHVMKNRRVITMVILGTVLVASFAGMEIPTVALIDKSLSGAVIAIFSIGSILGGLTLGHRNPGKWTVPGFFALGTVGYLLGMLAPTNPIWISICWFIGGIAVAPLLGTVNAMISASTSDADALEAYGWLNTGQLLGYAGAAVIVGFLIDNVNAAAGLWVAIGFSFVGLCVSLIGIQSRQEAK
jgi:MFS family permease